MALFIPQTVVIDRSAHSGQVEFDALKTIVNTKYRHLSLQDQDGTRMQVLKVYYCSTRI